MLHGTARFLAALLVVVIWSAHPACALRVAGQPAREAPTGLGPVQPSAPELPDPDLARPANGFRKPPFDLSHLVVDRLPPGVLATSLARWDWREQGIVTPVQNQGTCGACYAFASLASLESRILIGGGAPVNLSENNLKECNFYELNSIMDEGVPWGSCDGGNVWLTANHLSQSGAVLESCDPYVAADVACRATCPPVTSLLGMRQISGGAVPHPDVLKSALQRYGPLSVNIYCGSGDAWAREFGRYDGSYTLYYPGTQETNHLVLLVGYDDNLAHAGGRGAWIAKNSWGTDWGGPCGYGSTGGYFTIAYGSARFGEYAAAFLDWQDADPNCRLLYYDEAGANRRRGYTGRTDAWGLARYTAPTAGYVSRIEWWAVDATTDVDLYLYSSFDGQNLGSRLWQKENLSYPEPGYFSVAVNPPVVVTAGQAIVAVMRVQNASLTLSLTVDVLGPTAAGRTFMSSSGVSGSWIDTGASYQSEVGLRVRFCAQAQPSATASPTATRTATVSPTATRTATVTRTATRTASLAPGRRAFLPVVFKNQSLAALTPGPTQTPTPAPGVFGRVLRAGAPVTNVTLNLWKGDERTFWNFVGSAIPGPDGCYLFANVGTLDGGLIYMVNYRNTAAVPNPGPGYLYYWGGNRIAAYQAGTRVHGGDFDLVDLRLVAPADGASLALPATFCWEPRPVIGDIYQLVLDVPATGTYGLWVAPAGANCITVDSLPPNLPPGSPLRWSIYILLPGNVPYNYGVTYESRTVTLGAAAPEAP